MDIQINALKKPCPLPVIEARDALASMTEPGTLTVLVDNEVSAQNVLKLAARKSVPAFLEKQDEDHYIVRMEYTGNGSSQAVSLPSPGVVSANDCMPAGSCPSGITAVISSDCMGDGDPALGRTLMKAFLFALARQEQIPQTLLFYNSGIFLTCEDSECLADLKMLEEKGSEILSCGTCLDFYGRTDRLAVGGITNMYIIVEKQMQASRILRP